MKLSICIPTIVGREQDFNALSDFINIQIGACSEPASVEIVSIKDNKEMSIGAKRQAMYEMCKGAYAVQIDDDDWIHENYVQLVLNAINNHAPDCIGYKEQAVMDGQERYSSFSTRHGSWQTLRRPDENGLSYYRTPFTKSPIKTEICLKVGVNDMRFAEDHDFAQRVFPHLKTEHYIDEIMYYYQATTLTKRQHNERYGIY